MGLLELLGLIVPSILDYSRLEGERGLQNDRFDRGIELLDQQKGELRSIFGNLESQRPAFSIGGTRFGGDGNAIALDDFFNSADMFSKNYNPLNMEGFDPGLNDLSRSIGGNLSSINQQGLGFLQGQMSPVGSTFDAVDFPDFSGKAFSAKALGDIASQRESITDQNRNSVVSRGFASGKGLQEIQSNLANADRQVADQAASQARDVDATVEQNRLNFGAQRAGLQAQLAAADAARNAQLAQGQASLTGQLGSLGATLQSQLGSQQANMLLQAILEQQGSQERYAGTMAGFGQSDNLNRINTLFSGLNMDAQTQQALANLLAGLTTGQAGANFNFDPIIPQLSPAAFQIYNTLQANKEPEQPSSFGITTPLAGFTTGG